MDRAIDFDNDIRLYAAEVDDVSPKRLLPAKAKPVEAPFSHVTPQNPLAKCTVLAQDARALLYVVR
jgi:hypothetical protein